MLHLSVTDVALEIMGSINYEDNPAKFNVVTKLFVLSIIVIKKILYHVLIFLNFNKQEILICYYIIIEN